MNLVFFEPQRASSSTYTLLRRATFYLAHRTTSTSLSLYGRSFIVNFPLTWSWYLSTRQTDTRIQQQYIQHKIDTNQNPEYSEFLAEKLEQLQIIQQTHTDRQFFLIFFARTPDEYSDGNALISQLLISNNLARSLTIPQKLSVLERLNINLRCWKCSTTISSRSPILIQNRKSPKQKKSSNMTRGFWPPFSRGEASLPWPKDILLPVQGMRHVSRSPSFQSIWIAAGFPVWWISTA